MTKDGQWFKGVKLLIDSNRRPADEGSFLNLSVWDDDDSSIWKELIARGHKDDYYDETNNFAKRDAHIAVLKAEWDAAAYARTRMVSFPDVGKQLDLLYHDIEAGKVTKSGEFFKTLKKIKDDNAKPE